MSRARSASVLTVGSAVSGLLAYVFFALVTRALGSAPAAPVAVLWTYWSFTAAALTFPLQHWIVRSVAAAGGAEGHVRHAARTIAPTVLALAVVVGGVTFVIREQLFDRGGVTFPLLAALVTAGSAYVGVVRGVLTARRRLTAVALTLVAENGSRCLLAAALMVGAVATPGWYGAVLVAGMVTALWWPSVLRLDRRGPEAPTPWGRFVLRTSGGQTLAQALLTGGPLALTLLGGTGAEVTGLFVALALFRAPYTLAIGAISPVTGVLTRIHVRGRHVFLHRLTLGLGLATVLGCVAAGVLGGLAGPALIELVFGSSVQVAARVCVLTAAGSALALGALSLSLVAMARDRSHLILRGWSLAAVAAAGVLVAAPGRPLDTVLAGFVTAQVIGFLVLWVAQLPRPRDLATA